jgi:hypothetical protein
MKILSEETISRMYYALEQATTLLKELQKENEILKKTIQQDGTTSNKKICPQCHREFKTTEVKSGIFCCIACENGY